METFAKILSKLPQKIIWTCDLEELPVKTENIMIGKWFPQDDILAHENVKLFISHGGLGSVVEAKYHGVPILGVPFFADQSGNIRKIVSEGWGVSVNHKNLTENSLENAIIEMLENDKYHKKARELSLLFRDRPLTSKQLAIYWIEYVMRHRGAPHMRFQGADLNWLQKSSIDVIAFLCFITYAIYQLIKILSTFFAKLIVKLIDKTFKSVEKQKTN